MRLPWEWARRTLPKPTNGHADTDAETERDAAHRSAVRDLDERTTRVRAWVDAVDLITGPTPKERDR